MIQPGVQIWKHGRYGIEPMKRWVDLKLLIDPHNESERLRLKNRSLNGCGRRDCFPEVDLTCRRSDILGGQSGVRCSDFEFRMTCRELLNVKVRLRRTREDGRHVLASGSSISSTSREPAIYNVAIDLGSNLDLVAFRNIEYALRLLEYLPQEKHLDGNHGIDLLVLHH